MAEYLKTNIGGSRAHQRDRDRERREAKTTFEEKEESVGQI